MNHTKSKSLTRWINWGDDMSDLDEIEYDVAQGHWSTERLFTEMKQRLQTKDKQIAELEVGIAVHEISIETQRVQIAELFNIIKDASAYLDINEYTAIGHGSILHKEFKEIMSKHKQGG